MTSALSFHTVLAIASGGALGAVGRHYAATAVMRWAGGSFPMGTLCVNVLGSAAMGLIAGLLIGSLEAGPALRGFLTVGLLGGFTTFSTFSLETLLLLERHQYALGAFYALASVLLCVGAALAGLVAARALAGAG